MGTTQITPLRNLTYINLKDFCKIDGVTDDSAGFTTAYVLAASLGMALYHPGGTLVKGNDTLVSSVRIFGAGPGQSSIKLKNAANVDLFSAQTSSINLSASAASGAAGTLAQFEIEGLTLDGNKANQSSGTSYPIRFYGYNFVLRDLEVRNGYSGGILIDWNGDGSGLASSDGMESALEDIKIHDCSGIGLQMGGPHDTRLTNILSFNHSLHGFHFAPNADGLLCTNIHPYHLTQSVNAVGCLCEASVCSFVDCMFEGSDFIQFAAIASDISIIGGMIFGSSGYAGVGLQAGQSGGGTPIPGQINQSAGLTTSVSSGGLYIATKFNNCTNGALNEVNVGTNTYIIQAYQTSGTVLAGSGYPSSHANMILSVNGLTADGSIGKGGAFFLRNGSYNGFRLLNHSGDGVFNVDTYSSLMQLVNGSSFIGYSDDGSTVTYTLNSAHGNISLNGNLSVGQSATTPDPGANGTITTANIGLARVTPAASRAGVIMQAGTVPGQKCTVVNNSASFTITFATAATSNVAQGTSLVIAALGKYDFTWDSVAARWY